MFIVVNKCVELYKLIKPEDYAQAVMSVKEDRNIQRDAGKFAKGMDVLEKKVASYPEDLLMLLMEHLSPEELEFFNSNRGINWFAKNFPQFAI